MNSEKLNVTVEKVKLKLKDGEFIYHLLTIPDPCRKSIIYENKEVLPDPNNNAEPWLNHHLIVKIKKLKMQLELNQVELFLLYYLNQKMFIRRIQESSDFDEELYKKVVERNTTDNLNQWGMGQIFIELAKN